jgi:hypothetical protein
MQRWFELDAPQRAARIPRHPGSRPGPRRPVSLHPRERHLSSGPAGHGKRAGRKSGAKVNRISLARKTDPGKLTLRGPSSIALSNPSCHWRCVRDGMEARSRACTRPHHPPRLSFRSFSREGSRHSESRGAFHRGNRMTEGIAPWDIRQVLLATRPKFRFCSEERPRLFYRRSMPGADGSKQGWSSARLVELARRFTSGPPSRSALTASTTRPLAALTYPDSSQNLREEGFAPRPFRV